MYKSILQLKNTVFLQQHTHIYQQFMYYHFVKEKSSALVFFLGRVAAVYNSLYKIIGLL